MKAPRPGPRVRPPFAVALGLALVAAVGWADFATGRDLSVAVFYLPGVVLAAWYGRRWAGVLVAVAAAGAWLTAFTYAPEVELGRFVPYWNALGILGFFLVTVATLEKLRDALHREQARSREDPTTGVANARAFVEAARREIDRSRRSGRPFSLVFADCDDFKAVNDAHGHTAGDAVLREVALRIRGAVREIDLVARVGGDEFAVLLPETDGEGARAAVERVRAALRSPHAARDVRVTLSLGVSTFAGGWPTVEQALRDADRLMYEAKRAGKDTFRSEVLAGAAAPGA